MKITTILPVGDGIWVLGVASEGINFGQLKELLESKLGMQVVHAPLEYLTGLDDSPRETNLVSFAREIYTSFGNERCYLGRLRDGRLTTFYSQTSDPGVIGQCSVLVEECHSGAVQKLFEDAPPTLVPEPQTAGVPA